MNEPRQEPFQRKVFHFIYCYSNNEEAIEKGKNSLGWSYFLTLKPRYTYLSKNLIEETDWIQLRKALNFSP